MCFPRAVNVNHKIFFPRIIYQKHDQHGGQQEKMARQNQELKSVWIASWNYSLIEKERYFPIHEAHTWSLNLQMNIISPTGKINLPLSWHFQQFRLFLRPPLGQPKYSLQTSSSLVQIIHKYLINSRLSPKNTPREITHVLSRGFACCDFKWRFQAKG